jgi:hypothetical protein
MPFYPGPSSLEIYNKGTLLAGAASLNFNNGQVSLSGTTAEFTAPETSITDGSIIISPLNTLTVNSLSLAASLTFPTVRQEIDYNNNVQFSETPVSGNLLVSVITSGNANTPLGWTLQSDTSLNGIHAKIWTQIATGSMPTEFSGFYGPGRSYEIVTNSSVDFSQGAATVAAGVAVYPYELQEGILIAGFVSLPDQNPPNPNTPVPSSLSFNSAQQGPGGNAAVWLGFGSITSAGSIIGFSDTGMTQASVAFINIPASSTSGNASITG